MKVCRKCNIEKEFCEFQKRNDSKDGYRNICKKCRDKDRVNYYLENINYYKEYNKTHYENNKDEIDKRNKQYQKNNSDNLNKYHKLYNSQSDFYKTKRLLENKARDKIKSTISISKPISEMICIKCGKGAKHYHHENYNYLEKVISLCGSCHKNTHKTIPTIYPKDLFNGIEIPNNFKHKMIFE